MDYNSLNAKDPAMGLFEKDLLNAIEKAERRIEKEKNKEKLNLTRKIKIEKYRQIKF